MVKAALGGDSGLVIAIKHLGKQIFRFFGDVAPLFRIESKLLPHYILEDLSVVVSFERWVSAQEDEQDDTETPYIALFVILTF